MSAVKPTKIGKMGNVKGSMTSSSGRQIPCLPSRQSYGSSAKRQNRSQSTPDRSTPGFVQPGGKSKPNPGTSGKK